MKISISAILICSILMCACSLHSKTSRIPQSKLIKNSFDIIGDNNIKLKVEIEYTLSSTGYLNNGCRAQFIVTNIGAVPYTWKNGAKNKIVFEFSTSDGKVLQVSKAFFVNVDPGNSGSAMTVNADAGLNRFCTSVKALKLDR